MDAYKKCKIFISPINEAIVMGGIRYAREFQRPIGFIPSRSQVDSHKRGGGYTGFTPTLLRAFIEAHRPFNNEFDYCIERDHFGKTEAGDIAYELMGEDRDAGFDGVFIDSDDEKLYSLAADLRFMIQVGCGEGEQTYLSDRFIRRLEMANVHCPRIVWKSYPTGCKIDGMGNKSEIFGRIINQESFQFPHVRVRGHNCDYLTSEMFKKLAKFVHAVNVGPQVGVIATNAYLMGASAAGYNITDWCNKVVEKGKWKHWGPPSQALILGGHYHHRELPPKLIEDGANLVEQMIFEFLKMIHTSFVVERERIES